MLNIGSICSILTRRRNETNFTRCNKLQPPANEPKPRETIEVSAFLDYYFYSWLMFLEEVL